MIFKNHGGISKSIGLVLQTKNQDEMKFVLVQAVCYPFVYHEDRSSPSAPATSWTVGRKLITNPFHPTGPFLAPILIILFN